MIFNFSFEICPWVTFYYILLVFHKLKQLETTFLIIDKSFKDVPILLGCLENDFASRNNAFFGFKIHLFHRLLNKKILRFFRSLQRFFTALEYEKRITRAIFILS